MIFSECSHSGLVILDYRESKSATFMLDGICTSETGIRWTDTQTDYVKIPRHKHVVVYEYCISEMHCTGDISLLPLINKMFHKPKFENYRNVHIAFSLLWL